MSTTQLLPAATACPPWRVSLRLPHRVVRAASGPESVAVLAEAFLEGRRQRLLERLLDHSVQHRRNAKLTFAPAGFGDFHRAHRGWAILALPQFCFDGLPMPLEVGFHLLDGHSVDAGRASVGFHRQIRRPQVLLFENPFHGHFFEHLLPPPFARLRGLGSRSRFRHGGPAAASAFAPAGGCRSCCLLRISGTCPPAHQSPVAGAPFSVLRPFALPAFRRTSSLLRPLLTSPPLSRRRSPRVRCMNILKLRAVRLYLVCLSVTVGFRVF